MKNILLIVFAFLQLSVWSQKCDITTREFIKQFNYEIDTIDADIYGRVSTSKNILQVIPKSEIEFQNEYPNIFTKIGLCYNFNTEEGEKLTACNIDTSSSFKENFDYKFEGQYCNNALILVRGYESWAYLSINLTDGSAFSTLGKPNAINCNTIYSYANYYGEDEISIINFKTNKQLGLIIDEWSTIDSKHIGNEIYLKMKSLNCSKIVKYIKITIK